MLARAFAISVVLAALPGAAHATDLIIEDASVHERAPNVSAMAILGVFGAYQHYGFGGWYAFPVLPDGLIPTINEALYVEFGASIGRYGYSNDYSFGPCSYSWYRLTPMGGARWNFYFTPEWSAYGRAMLGYSFGFGDNFSCGGYTVNASPTLSTLVPMVAIGANWQFSPDWSLRFELGNWPQAGVSTDL